MTRTTGFIAMGMVLMLAGCGSAGTTTNQATPAVNELARLQSMGQLDWSRLVCVTETLAAASRALPEEAHRMREVEAAVRARTMTDHAASVQQGMHAGDAMAEAGRLAANAFSQAAALEAQGHDRTALLVTGHAMDLEQRARAMDVIVVAGPRRSGTWSDEEAELFVEYAALMLERTTAGDAVPEVQARIAEIESGHPEVMDGYVSALLELYRDPGLPCVPGS